MKTIRLIELFAGYGSQALALKYLKLPFEHHFVCEFDKHAIQSYNEIHSTNFETSDVNNITAKDLNIVDRTRYNYLLTYSFPCTDLSLAGKQLGMARDSGTRSSLLWQVERILKECGDNLPQYLMMENVPQVIGKGNAKNFKEWVEFLVSLGYDNYYQIMNATDYGVPQHRERVIMISILKSENKYYQFPKPIKLTKTFEDVMETGEIDPKYYLSSTTIERISKWKSYQNPLDHIIKPDKDTAPTLTARGAGEEHAGMQLVFDDHELVDYGSSQKFWRDIPNDEVVPTLKTHDYLGVAETMWRPAETGLITDAGNVKTYSYLDDEQEFKEGQTADLSYPGGYGHGGGRISNISPTLTASATSSIATKESCYFETDDVDELIALNNKDAKHQQDLIQSSKGVCKTIPAGVHGSTPHCLKTAIPTFNGCVIRKLTPRECFRLMGVKDEDSNKLTCSDQQKYKQAGNSIVVDVLMAAFSNLFINECKRKSLF